MSHLVVLCEPGGGGRRRMPAPARYWCNNCPPHRQMWRPGGPATADKHTAVLHPGRIADYDTPETRAGGAR